MNNYLKSIYNFIFIIMNEYRNKEKKRNDVLYYVIFL